MAYREFRPAERLKDFVTCTWERDAPAPGIPKHTAVLPDGCVDLVWRRGELLVAGPDSRPFLSPLPADDAIVGLRLRPGIAGPALGLPASELRDSRVPLEDVWGRPPARWRSGSARPRAHPGGAFCSRTRSWRAYRASASPTRSCSRRSEGSAAPEAVSAG